MDLGFKEKKRNVKDATETNRLGDRYRYNFEYKFRLFRKSLSYEKTFHTVYQHENAKKSSSLCIELATLFYLVRIYKCIIINVSFETIRK